MSAGVAQLLALACELGGGGERGEVVGLLFQLRAQLCALLLQLNGL